VHQNDETLLAADGGSTAFITSHITVPSASSYYKQYKIASDPVTPSVEQRRIIKFLVKEKVKQAEILHMLSVQDREDTLARESVYDWSNKFSEGCEQVANRPHVYVQPTAVTCEHSSHRGADFGKQTNCSA
jgi:hypothetical protein